MMGAHGFFFLLCAALLGGVQTESTEGFINIDCGLTKTPNYNNPVDNLTYVSDEEYIDSGVNVEIDPTRLPSDFNEGYGTVRFFPNYTRNCYQLPAAVDGKYIVRAAFRYSNYDGLNRVPSFDLYLGVDLWDTVSLTDKHTYFRTELVVQAEASFLYVCLVNTGHGTPFISALKLRPIPEDVYAPANATGSLALKTFKRIDVGATKYTLYPNDRLDRIWEPNNDSYGTPYATEQPVREPDADPQFLLPSVVMQTAVYSKDEILVTWAGGVDDKFYLYLEFADVVRPANGLSRQMNVQVNGQDSGNITVSYLESNVLYSDVPLSLGATQYSFSIRSDNASDELGAVLNSFEVYKALTFNGSATDPQEVTALQAIKKLCNLKKNWIGDPCLPVAPWDGLACSYNASTPRIVTLDLSNCQLNGPIASQISNLTALKTLNLSRNNLKGPVPAFLQDLQNLLYIDLSSNDLSGSIPPGLQERSKNGEIILSIDDNPRICGLKCEENRRNIIVISIVVSLVVTTIILFWGITMIKRRKQDKMEEGRPPTNNKEMVDSLLRPDACSIYRNGGTFTYSEVVEMTNNFEKVIGRGGSGTVFYGRLKDGHEVAVKKLSSKLAEQGTKEFAAEVKMLRQVHHKHLTSLVGYSLDEKEMILIYEYMSKGNLHKQLSATGLEYLHSGCKPAFIHRDVKSSNILINENFEAKISDFGLSKSVVSDELTHITTVVAGTAGYLDPEYWCTNKVTEKSDVYGFGVVLFELITGRAAISTNLEGERVPLVQLVLPDLKRGDIGNIIDPRLQGQYDVNSIKKVAETAMACTEEKSAARPTMIEVMFQLKEAMEIETSRDASGSKRMLAVSTSSQSFDSASLSATATSYTYLPIHPSAR